jgi:hypothetical protein
VPFTVVEFRESRRHYRAKDTEAADLMFVGFGDVNNQTAAAAFDVAIPTTFVSLAGGNTLTLLSRDVSTVGGGFWRAMAHYGPDGAPLFPAVGGIGDPLPPPSAPGLTDALGPDFAFDFTGVTEHILQSKETMNSARNGGGAVPDTKGAIGITADGRVEGCQRISPNFEWSRTVTFASITWTYLIALSDMVGTVNDSEFYHHAAGECLLLGGNCQIDDTLRAKVTFKFMRIKNRTTVPICDGFTLEANAPRTFAKLGHEYLWCSYENAKDANARVMIPKAAYVEKIYDLADFTLLRIGS